MLGVERWVFLPSLSVIYKFKGQEAANDLEKSKLRAFCLTVFTLYLHCIFFVKILALIFLFLDPVRNSQSNPLEIFHTELRQRVSLPRSQTASAQWSYTQEPTLYSQVLSWLSSFRAGLLKQNQKYNLGSVDAPLLFFF